MIKPEKTETENNITITHNSNNVEDIPQIETQQEQQPELFYLNLENLACFVLPDKVFDICESKDGSLIACCLDKSIKIYNMEIRLHPVSCSMSPRWEISGGVRRKSKFRNKNI